MHKNFMSNNNSVEASEVVDFDISLDGVNGMFNHTHQESVNTNADSRALNLRERSLDEKNYSMDVVGQSSSQFKQRGKALFKNSEPNLQAVSLDRKNKKKVTGSRLSTSDYQS